MSERKRGERTRYAKRTDLLPHGFNAARKIVKKIRDEDDAVSEKDNIIFK